MLINYLFRFIRISPFANRLSFDVPPDVQRLRCLANYEALRFSSLLLTMGQILVSRMKERSANNGGKYVSVHLRFEEVSSLFLFFLIIHGQKLHMVLFILLNCYVTKMIRQILVLQVAKWVGLGKRVKVDNLLIRVGITLTLFVQFFNYK